MPKYAIIEDGVVVNIVLADSRLQRNWIETEEAGPGWLYANGKLTPPPPPPAPSRREQITSRLEEIDKQTTKPRTVRELALGNEATVAWVSALDAEAAALRTELGGL